MRIPPNRRFRAAASLLAAALALGALCAQPPRAQEREMFSGAALLYTVARVTIVYPAGEGQPAERNRISAERRAAYLEGRHDTEVTVVADTDVTAETLAANLLILGWDNALLERLAIVRRDEKGWEFEGIRRDDSRDLLFSWVSPFNDKKEVVFWSRIDPELDRFLVLPFFGSDWIVYDGYFVEQFGRFRRDELTWPPVRNPEVEEDRRERHGAPPLRAQSEHYRLYATKQRASDEEVVRILDAREDAFTRAAWALGIDLAPDAQEEKIRLFLYDDAEQKEDECSVHDARHHMPRRGELHLVKTLAEDPDPHEDSHLVARRLYGPGYLSAFVEGLAVWIEQREDGRLDTLAAMLVEAGRLPTIADLLDEETLRVLIRERVGFPAAGLFVGWLRTRFDEATFRRVYGQYSSDPAELAAALGKPAEALEKDFRGWVEERAAAGQKQREKEQELASAVHFGRIGDFVKAVELLEGIVERWPDDAEARYTLAVSYRRAGRPERAEETLETLLAEDRAVSRYTVYGSFLLGELLQERGDRDGARRAFSRVLEAEGYRSFATRARRALEELDPD